MKTRPLDRVLSCDTLIFKRYFHLKETTVMKLQKAEVIQKDREKVVRKEDVNVDDAQLAKVTMETPLLVLFSASVENTEHCVICSC